MNSRNGYRSGYHPRRLDTLMGTMYLMVPKVRQGGYIPFFVMERKRSEAALIQVVQEAFVQGVSTRKTEKLAQSLGIENLSRSKVSEMSKGFNNQVNEFRNRPLSDTVYPILWVDALYEKVRVDGRIDSMALLIVCGVDENGRRNIIAVEPMAEESRDSYGLLFQNLKERGLRTPKLIIWSGFSYPGILPRRPPGSAVRYILCGISWPVCRKKRKNLSSLHGRKSGWLPLWNWRLFEALSQSCAMFGKWFGRFSDSLCIPEAGCPENLVIQHD